MLLNEVVLLKQKLPDDSYLMVLNGTPESSNSNEEKEDSAGHNPADNVETKSENNASKLVHYKSVFVFTIDPVQIGTSVSSMSNQI